MDFVIITYSAASESEFDLALFYKLPYFEHRILDSVASVSKITFSDLFINPTNEFRQNAYCKLYFDHLNPATSYELRYA